LSRINRLQIPIPPDMQYGGAELAQRGLEEMVAMAAARILLAAHHHDGSVRGIREELSHAILIGRLTRHHAVVDVSLAHDTVPITGGVIGTPAERAPRPNIADARVVQIGAERFAAEMRPKPAEWGATDIDEGFQPVVS
jgi:hypothetical protein